MSPRPGSISSALGRPSSRQARLPRRRQKYIEFGRTSCSSSGMQYGCALFVRNRDLALPDVLGPALARHQRRQQALAMRTYWAARTSNDMIRARISIARRTAPTDDRTAYFAVNAGTERFGWLPLIQDVAFHRSPDDPSSHVSRLRIRVKGTSPFTQVLRCARSDVPFLNVDPTLGSAPECLRSQVTSQA
jgi:hypothetical protein